MEKNASSTINTPLQFPEQHQNTQPGSQQQMNPIPVTEDKSYQGSGKLNGTVAIITVADSGIGQAAAVAFAKEGADIVAAFYSEQEDADETVKMIKAVGRKCILVKCDLKQEPSSKQVVDTALQQFGHIDILVNNIAVQFPQNSLEDITEEQLVNTFSTNIYSYFFMTKAVLPYLNSGASIINTASVTAFKGSPT
jgi:NAD(P)-dependent dehydrogenase (short-subunit alcohol dehydrogenase family)